jgi:hypothetical protein
MIENDQQLEATYQALGCLYRALASLRRHILPLNARQYALFAEGPAEEIRKLESEINSYLGIGSTATGEALPNMRETPPLYGKPED